MKDGEIPVGNENCDECLFQAAQGRDFNILGHVLCQYDMTYFDEEPLSPAAQNIEHIDMAEEEEEEIPEEDDPEEEIEEEEY